MNMLNLSMKNHWSGAEMVLIMHLQHFNSLKVC
ncbi:unnamed protein product [Enterobius vermicularis]|uniref:Uncharacterized protein n=1 Tax=Enterobius vermicularis TaxID=51028 RepID=A0A0N4V0N5_ENTVE|nr:unnamed protein product [Enterobius vermicularis]